MACFQPLLAVAYGSRDEGYKLHFVSTYGRTLKEIREIYSHDKLMFLPCNNCIGCAKDYARAWQCRIMCEYESRREREKEKALCCFLTLTYSSECPRDPSPVHLREFIKSVRNKFGNGIKFFGCGEKGELHGRSHYHLILFGIDFPDKQIVAKRGQFYCYESKIANELWSRGFVQLGSLDIKSAGYVSKYCDKKKVSHVNSGEFVIMSRGLGKQYFQDHKKEIFDSDYLYFEGNKFKMPRIFLRWALNDEDFYLKVCASDYQDRKEIVASNFRYDKCRSVAREEEGLHEQKSIEEYKYKQEELVRNAFD